MRKEPGPFLLRGPFGARFCCALLPILVAGCACAEMPPANPEDLNVIVIVLDSLRADHLGCYGYHRNTSPFIDALAKEGVVFEQAIAPSTYTRQSVAAILMGILPSMNSLSTGWFARPDRAIQGMGELFAGAGYSTVFLTDSPAFERAPFGAGFTDAARVPTPWGGSGSGAELSERALEFAKKYRGGKFLMYVHYLDPHLPYRPPDDYYLRFAPKRFPNPLDIYTDVKPNVPKLVAEGFGPGEPRYEDLVTSYDGEIALNDHAIALLFEGLKNLEVLDRTLVIVTADHGEEFLDHGFVEHAWTVYSEATRVPLIFWRPGMFAPNRIAARVSLCDLLPTLTRLLAAPCSRTDFSGAALFDKKGDAWEFVSRANPIVSELTLETRPIAHAVIKDGYKYIAWQKWMTPAQCSEAARADKAGIAAVRAGTYEKTDILGPIVHEELYCLDTDPQEKSDLIEKAPERLADLRAILQTYLKSCPKPAAAPTKEFPEELELSPEQEEMLRSQGYL